MWAAATKHVELGQHVSVKVSYLAPPPSHSGGAESGCAALTSHVEAPARGKGCWEFPGIRPTQPRLGGVRGDWLLYPSPPL